MDISNMDVKNQIVEGAKQYSNFVTTNVPQLDENGNVKYYFSGSLAMLLLTESESVKSMFLDENGQLLRNRPTFEVSEYDRQHLARGIRQIGADIDVVAIQNGFFNKGTNAYFNLTTVRNNCSLATVLCPGWVQGTTAIYLDILGEERGFKGHDIAEITMKDGSRVFISDPLCMVIHKLADAIMCLDLAKDLDPENEKFMARIEKYQKKYEKDINDFTSMFNGVGSHYENFDFLQVVDHIYKTYDSTFSSMIEKNRFGEMFQQFHMDTNERVENNELLFRFMDAISTKHKEICKEKNQ